MLHVLSLYAGYPISLTNLCFIEVYCVFIIVLMY